jgi:protein-disulfide isomerase-like protein with CxxC motif
MVKSAQHCISDLLDEWPESLPYMAHTSNPTFLLRIQRMRFSEGTSSTTSSSVATLREPSSAVKINMAHFADAVPMVQEARYASHSTRT